MVSSSRSLQPRVNSARACGSSLSSNTTPPQRSTCVQRPKSLTVGGCCPPVSRPYASLGRPLAAGLAGGLTDAGALVEVLVHPGVDEPVQPAELAGPAGRQGGELLPRLN